MERKALDMDSQSLPLVSIVTPVYNEEEYLAECIESVLAQTYQNWEYTIVDNCSTDGSVQIARQYAARDGRIRVVENQEFLPALPNFNRALRQIGPASKYCKVVLGDDWMFPECLQRMVALAEEHPSVGVVSAYALEGKEVKCLGLPAQSSFFPGREICRQHFLEGVYVFGSPTNVLYRADLVRRQDPFYNEANIHADTEACFALLKTSDFGFVHQILTYSRVRLSSRSIPDKNNQTDLAGFLETLVKHGPTYLTQDEFNGRLDQHVAVYYHALGRSLLRGSDRMFWDYHRAKLVEAGIDFSHMRVVGGAAANLWEALLSPINSIEKLRRRRINQHILRTPERTQKAGSGMEEWVASHRPDRV